MMVLVPEAARITRIEDLPSISVAGVNWRPVRRELDVRAFGVNAYTADAGETLIEEHDETGDGAGGHEEMYVVVAGRARFTIDGADHDASAGTIVFLPDLMAGVIGDHPGNLSVLFNTAWFEALAGRREAALEHLRQAGAIDADKVRRWAAEDHDLDSLRDAPDFPG